MEGDSELESFGIGFVFRGKGFYEISFLCGLGIKGVVFGIRLFFRILVLL